MSKDSKVKKKSQHNNKGRILQNENILQIIISQLIKTDCFRLNQKNNLMAIINFISEVKADSIIIKKQLNMETQQIASRDRQGQLQKQENFYSKVFDFGIFKTDYSNSNIMRTAKPNQRAPTLMISNYLCKRQGNILRKVTEIRLDDKIITIQDRYSIVIPENVETCNQLQISSPDNSAKIDSLEEESVSKKRKMTRKKTNRTLMPKKRHLKFNEDFQLDQQKRDTKNVPRNIIRAFSNYLYEQQMPEFQEMIKLTDKLGYNNALVEDVIKNKKLNQEFKKFLIESAHGWLNASRIKDKKSHVQAMQIYLKMTDRQLGKQKDELLKSNQENLLYQH